MLVLHSLAVVQAQVSVEARESYFQLLFPFVCFCLFVCLFLLLPVFLLLCRTGRGHWVTEVSCNGNEFLHLKLTRMLCHAVFSHFRVIDVTLASDLKINRPTAISEAIDDSQCGLKESWIY